VAQYLVELYVPLRAQATITDAADRARLASEQLTHEGKHVRYLSTIFIPQDEICFHLYEAQAAALVDEASVRAQIAYERIVPAVSVDRGNSNAHKER
jgi:hypothetical protein